MSARRAAPCPSHAYPNTRRIARRSPRESRVARHLGWRQDPPEQSTSRLRPSQRREQQRSRCSPLLRRGPKSCSALQCSRPTVVRRCSRSTRTGVRSSEGVFGDAARQKAQYQTRDAGRCVSKPPGSPCGPRGFPPWRRYSSPGC